MDGVFENKSNEKWLELGIVAQITLALLKQLFLLCVPLIKYVLMWLWVEKSMVTSIDDTISP